MLLLNLINLVSSFVLNDCDKVVSSDISLPTNLPLPKKIIPVTKTKITKTKITKPTITTKITTKITKPTSTSKPGTLTTSSVVSLPTMSGNMTDSIPKKSGNTATLTYFTDTVFQCVGEIPDYPAVAVNPLLLGFTLDDWNTKYAGASPDKIPWCNRLMKFEINDVTFTARIIDTCNPGDTGAFVDPNTGKIIGGKCDYVDVIDLYGESGRQFLQNVVGDDFYRGEVKWEIL